MKSKVIDSCGDWLLTTNIATDIKFITDHDRMSELGKAAAEYDPTNFKHFDQRIENYLVWILAYIGKEPAAMCGIWRCNKWFDNLYRVGDRSFYFPIMRERSLAYDIDNRALLSKELLPIQLDFVAGMKGIPFVSMLKNKNALKRGMKSYNDLGYDQMKVLDSTYYTCDDDHFTNERCWQWISVLEKQEWRFNDRTLRSSV